MNKRLFLALLVLFSTTLTIKAQLLYRISGKDLTKPSYVVGTYHLAPSAFVDSIPGLRAAIEEVEQVCGEVVMKEITLPENVQKMTQAMMLPEGQTIQTILSKDEMGRLNSVMKEIMGVDFSNPMVGGQLSRLTPQALSTQLTLMTYMKIHPTFNPADAIDDYLQKVGTEKGKKICGLETIDEQVKVLFLSSTLERQKELLLCFVDNKDYQLQLAEELINAYFSQNLEKIKTVTDEKLGNSCDSTEEEEFVILDGRNANWIKLLPSMMASTPTLFVVGAAHLVGEKGLLSLLRNAGYQVDGVR